MSTTLAKVSESTQKKIDSVTSRLNNTTSAFISDVLAVYQSDAAVTPQHFIVDLTPPKAGKASTRYGIVQAAWYVHKSGLTIDQIKGYVMVIARNYSTIKVESTADAMLASLKAIKDTEDADTKAANRTANESGAKFIEGLDDLDDLLDDLNDYIPTASPVAIAKFMSIKAKVAVVEQKIKFLSQEKEPSLTK